MRGAGARKRRRLARCHARAKIEWVHGSQWAVVGGRWSVTASTFAREELLTTDSVRAVLFSLTFFEKLLKVFWRIETHSVSFAP